MSAAEQGLREMIKELVREVLSESQPTAAPSEYLSTDAAAKIADVSPATVRRWVREGRLAHHRAGRRVRIVRADLENLMRAPAVNDRNLSPEALAHRAFERRR